MTADEEAVLAAAQERASALGRRSADELRALLHPRFAWTSHRGEVFDRESYIRSNVGGSNRWHGQRLEDPVVVVAGDTAVLRCLVVDDVDTGSGREAFHMPMTQTWVRTDDGWLCLAGHAGPRST